MIKEITTIFLANRQYLLLVFSISFIIGFSLAIGTYRLNREKKKKGFRNGILYGKSKEIDKQIYEDYKHRTGSPYLNDTIEHHANRKFE